MGKQGEELGLRELQSVFKGAGIHKSDRVNTKVVQSEFPVNGMITIADDYDAVMLLLTRPIGHLLLGTAAALTAAGTYWAWRIVHANV